MNLLQYFEKVKNEIRNNNYIIINIKNIPINKKLSLHIETLNYMIYEWNEDHKDERNDIFDYIIKSNDCNFDFTSISFENFFNFLMLAKDKENEMIELKNDLIQINLKEKINKNEKNKTKNPLI